MFHHNSDSFATLLIFWSHRQRFHSKKKEEYAERTSQSNALN